MSMHKDHRQRVKNRYAVEGLDRFDEHQVLELLLFYCIPRKDTNEIAHRLLKRFGSINQVFDAPQKKLEEVEGMGPGAAQFLKLLRDLERYNQLHLDQKVRVLQTLEDCGRYLIPYFKGCKNEKVYMLCLDGKCKVLACREIGEGSINSTNISIRKIVDVALSENATSVVLAHNHPGGVAVPSVEDIQVTSKIADALRLVDVIVVDHVIVSDDEYVSMVESRKYIPDAIYRAFNEVPR